MTDPKDRYISLADIGKFCNPFREEDVEMLELVRCKECRFHEYEEPGMVWCPNVVGSWMTEDGFCSRGERKEDETD